MGIRTPGRSERHRKAKIDNEGQVSPVTCSERLEMGGRVDEGGDGGGRGP